MRNWVPPSHRNLNRHLLSGFSPEAWFRARGGFFMSIFALAWAEVLECSDIFIGVTAVDYSGYPD